MGLPLKNLAAQIAGLGFNLASELVVACQYIQPSSTDYDPQSGKVTPTNTTKNVNAMILNFSQKEIDNTTVKVGDERVLIKCSELLTVSTSIIVYGAGTSIANATFVKSSDTQYSNNDLNLLISYQNDGFWHLTIDGSDSYKAEDIFGTWSVVENGEGVAPAPSVLLDEFKPGTDDIIKANDSGIIRRVIGFDKDAANAIFRFHCRREIKA